MAEDDDSLLHLACRHQLSTQPRELLTAYAIGIRCPNCEAVHTPHRRQFTRVLPHPLELPSSHAMLNAWYYLSPARRSMHQQALREGHTEKGTSRRLPLRTVSISVMARPYRKITLPGSPYLHHQWCTCTTIIGGQPTVVVLPSCWVGPWREQFEESRQWCRRWKVGKPLSH